MHLCNFFSIFFSASSLSPGLHCMKLFLECLFLHFCQGSEGYSPLLVACKFHKTDLVKYLLGFPEVDPTLKTSVSLCCKLSRIVKSFKL